MKNKKLIISMLLIGLVSLFIGIRSFFFVVKEQVNQNKPEKQKNNLALPEAISDQEENKKASKIIISETNQIKNMFAESAFLTVVSLKNAPLTQEKKIDLLNKINSLYKYGSLSGGKITHEFSNIEKYRNFQKKYGYNTIKEKVSFSPKDLLLSNSTLKLTGSYYSGGYTKNKGFDSLYRLYEAPNGEKIEINQTKLSKDGMKLLIIEETLNYRLPNEIPATFETFDYEKTYSLRFFHNGYRYAISTQNLDKNYIINLANYLTEN
ncbi:hypothetical protein ACG94V_16510 [Acinetobacter sp. ULE_I001]|uniref:hypothetical protein n=1 Tax=unclassified Acinetobacter TaxID=196816 RepID=UPI003AF83E96